MILTQQHSGNDRRALAGRRGAAGFFAVFFLALVGLGLVALALLMPVSGRAIDPAVLARAGQGTQNLQQAGEAWVRAGKPGTAALFARAQERLAAAEGDLPVVVRAGTEEDPMLRLWGGHDPFLEQAFSSYQPTAAVESPPVIPLFLSRESRQQLSSFLSHARNQAVRAVMSNLRVEYADRFMPAGSAAGQPLEATLYLTGLLLQGNHFSPAMADEIRRQAEQAAEENRLGQLETVYLDIFALGTRLQWQGLADLLPLIQDRHALRRTAHLSQILKEDWPVVAAAAIWSRNPGDLSSYLVRHGRDGLEDLQEAMLQGEGALRLLVERQAQVAEPAWRRYVGEVPVLFPGFAARAPELSTVIRILALLGGFLSLFLAINTFTQVEARGRTLGRPFSFTLLQSSLLAAAVALTVFVFNEPLLAPEGPKSEFRISLPITIASTQSHVSTEKELSLNMDQITLISLSVFFALQLIVYVICWIKVMEIRRQPIASHLKLKLLENEDNLFDSGLYVGLAGTVGALIFLALGVIEGALMAAYASTLFGIVFVAVFKICHLRPYRRRLILESQSVAA